MKKRTGKALPILLGLLAVIAIVGAVIYVPKMLDKQKVDGVANRVVISSTLMRAVRKLEDADKAWPKTIEDLKKDPEVAALGDLNGIGYDFVGVDKKGMATYSMTIEGKSKSVNIVPKRLMSKEPMAAKAQ